MSYKITISSPYFDKFVKEYADADPAALSTYIEDAEALAADLGRETSPDADYYSIIRTFSYLVETT